MEKKLRSNPECRACEKCHQSLNGHYCSELKVYVEYASHPRCWSDTNK